jgi:hypothetical protein
MAASGHCGEGAILLEAPNSEVSSLREAGGDATASPGVSTAEIGGRVLVRAGVATVMLPREAPPVTPARLP